MAEAYLIDSYLGSMLSNCQVSKVYTVMRDWQNRGKFIWMQFYEDFADFFGNLHVAYIQEHITVTISILL